MPDARRLVPTDRPVNWPSSRWASPRTGFAFLDCPSQIDGTVRHCAAPGQRGDEMVESEALKAWFFQEVLPLEPALMRFLRRNWRNGAELVDLRQDIYARVFDAAREGLPLQTKAFLFATARNHLINRAKRSRVISFEQVADLEALSLAVDAVTPDRHATAREELRRVQAGLQRLPPRCCEVLVLRKIEGLSQREVAARMGIGEDTVERQMVQGMRALVDFMLGGTGRIRRASNKSKHGKRKEHKKEKGS